jgi:flagellar protein FlbD
MIRVTRLNHTPLVLNSDLIQEIETTPDTVITLTNGQKLMVLESADQIVDRVLSFRQQIVAAAGAGQVPGCTSATPPADNIQDISHGR